MKVSKKPKNIVLLGATGSIGESACKVARSLPERMRITGMAANRSTADLAAKANEFRPALVCLFDENGLDDLREGLEYAPEILVGEEGLMTLAQQAEADMVLVAIVGTRGLKPALAAIDAGKDLAVASKEILVMAGPLMMAHARANQVNVLPVDSEHNAIFQCLQGVAPGDVKRVILTASGGPFRQTPASGFPGITVDQALKHPTWKMGRKITIDSATLFNKGLEMIEARWLFGLRMEQVDVIVHPQSIVHSLVETCDNSILAQLSHSDMCFPIQYAVTWPERVPNDLAPLDLAQLACLDFEKPRLQDFPALTLARRAGEKSGTLPAVLNAANEIAVEAFVDGKIGFPGIWELVEETMNSHEQVENPDIDAILRADEDARRQATALLESS